MHKSKFMAFILNFVVMLVNFQKDKILFHQASLMGAV
jgi:hypothetical protein